jgi:hypothetical protein
VTKQEFIERLSGIASDLISLATDFAASELAREATPIYPNGSTTCVRCLVAMKGGAAAMQINDKDVCPQCFDYLLGKGFYEDVEPLVPPPLAPADPNGTVFGHGVD